MRQLIALIAHFLDVVRVSVCRRLSRRCRARPSMSEPTIGPHIFVACISQVSRFFFHEYCRWRIPEEGRVSMARVLLLLAVTAARATLGAVSSDNNVTEVLGSPANGRVVVRPIVHANVKYNHIKIDGA